jgi:chemotaxis protein methyltransferase CheR
MRTSPNGVDASESDFSAASAAVRRLTGNVLSGARWPAIEQRLLRRVRATGAQTLAQYLERLASEQPTHERDHFVACVTTNETSFFREPAHFAILADAVKSGALAIPEHDRRRLRVWSAACSTGEEPWSLGMTLLEHAPPQRSVRVLGTDISADALRAAKTGQYGAAAVRSIPAALRQKYLRAVDGGYQPGEALRSIVRFRKLNLVADAFVFDAPVDVIFCRNVLIYFDSETVDVVIEKFYRALRPGGYLFTGHAETLLGKQMQWEYVASTAYRRRGVEPADG